MVTDAARLLPSNSTPLEIALARAAPRSLLDVQASAPGWAPMSPPEQFAPWLAAEWRLSEFSKYFDTTQQLLDAGLPWLRQRGTAAAVKRALSWIGFSATLEQEGPWLQIDPGDAYAQIRLDAIIHLVRASLPAHAQLYRLYHGYDLRPIILDRSRLDDGMLDDDSGVVIDGIKLSFGATRGGIADAPMGPIGSARTNTLTGVVPYADRMLLDSWVLDSELVHDGRFAMGQLFTGTLVGTVATPPTITAHRTLAISQVVLDGDVVGLDDINSHLGGSYKIVEQPMRLDGDQLDSHDIEARHVFIDEFTASLRQAELPAYVLPSLGGVSIDQVFSGTTEPLDVPAKWTGGWGARPWRTSIPSTITSYGA